MSKRIVKELLVLAVALLVAGGIMYGYTQNVSAQPTYKVLAGEVDQLPLTVSSPIYGEILSLPVAVGAHVSAGETLATIQRLDGDKIALPQHTDLFHIKQNGTIDLVSPVNGIVSDVQYAPHSTVATAAPLLDLATVQTTQLVVFLPTTDRPQDFVHFAAAASPSSTRLPIQLVKPLPVQGVNNVPQKTIPYLATFANAHAGEQLIGSSTITIFATQKPQNNGLLSLCATLCHS